MQYTITEKNMWLKIQLEESEKIGLAKALEEATESIPVLENRFVELMGMKIVSPEENGDLTNGAIITDGRYDWWDNNYQIRSFLNILSEEGEVYLMWARSHDMPLTREEQISFLSQLFITQNILNLPMMYSVNITGLDIVVWAYEDTKAYQDLFEALQQDGLGYHIYNPVQLLSPVEFIDLGATTAFELVDDDKGGKRLSPTLVEATDEVLKLQTENVYPLYCKAIKLLEQYSLELEEELKEEELKEE